MNAWLKQFGASMNWPFNLSKKGKVSDPFGDYDGDGLQNLNDCRPKNPKKQDMALTPMGSAGQQQVVANQVQKIPIKKDPEEPIIIQ